MAVSNFISNGGFGMGSFNRAKAAGYSDLDIYNFLSRYNGTIGDQVRSNMATFNQSQAQSQGGLGLESYNRALASGQTPQQFFDYAKGSGLTIGGGLQAEMDKYAASQAQPMQISDAKGVNQALKIAGEGGITKQELNQITKQFDTPANKVVQRLDQINQNLKAKDQTGINLNSGAANMLIKQAGPAYGTTFLGMEPTFGTGRIGQALEGMRGTRASGGYQNPQSGYGSVTPGTDRRFMIGGTTIRPGGRIAVNPMGAAPAVAPTAETTAPTTAPTTTTTAETPGDAFDFQSILDALTGAEQPQMDMSALTDMFNTQFDELTSQFETMKPFQLAQLGRAYGGDAIRAAQRMRKTRRDYRRGLPAQALGQAFTNLAIGGGMTL
jgi:hypothetical protein